MRKLLLILLLCVASVVHGQTLTTSLVRYSGDFTRAQGITQTGLGYFFDSLVYLTGNQTITLGTDLSGSGATTLNATIVPGAVTLAKMADIATGTLIGRNTAGTGVPEALTSIPTAITVSSLTSFGNSPTFVTPILGTPTSGTLTNCTFPTLNQNTTGSAAKWTTARNLAGNSVDGSANVAFSNAFIVQGTSDAGLSGAQFLGSLGTGIVKNTTTTGVLSIAVAGDFPTLNQSTTGSAATLTTSRNINSVAFNGSADITVTAAAGTLTGTTLNSTVVTSSLTAVGANCAMTTPVITGLATGSGVASAATASTLVARDANANITANNWIGGYRTTATAAGTTTLTIADTYLQFFTGVTTQTVTLPVVSTLALGHQFVLVNNSTGAVTVNSSGGNAVVILAASTSAIVTSIATSGTDATVWSLSYAADNVTSAKKLSVSNTLTLAGTDGTTMTFPGTSATIARTDAANTFTGVQTMTSPALTTPVLGTPTSGNLTNCTWGSASGLINSNAGTITFNTAAAGSIPFSTSTTALTANSTNLTYTATAGVLDRISDAGTNTSVDLLTLTHNSSGVIAASFGTGLAFNGQSSTTADRNIADISAIWTTATDASRVGNLVFQVASNTALATAATIAPTTFNIPTGSSYQINGTNVLTNNTLGTGVLTSSLTTIGTCTAGSVPGAFIGTQVILNGTTTYTPTTGTKTVTVVLVGAGGGGGGVKGAASSSGAAGGGGGGGTCIKTFGSVSGTYTVAVGALGGGGSGVTPSNGSLGGNTTFTNGGTTYTAFGGSGGVAMTSNSTLQCKAGGAGGVVSTNGDVNGGGEPGAAGFTVTAALCNSGGGGSTPYGGGGVGLNSSSATGTAGTGFGAGGAGAACIANSNQTGGAGTNGVIIIYEYK